MCIFSKLCESTSITGAVCGAVKEQALDLVAPDSRWITLELNSDFFKSDSTPPQRGN